MSEEPKKNVIEEPFIKRYDTIFAFLGIEIIALTCFGIGGLTGLTFLRIIGFFVSLALIPFIKANHQKSDIARYLIVLIPTGILAILLGFSKFWFSAYSSSTNTISIIVENLTVSIGLAGFLMLGYGLKNISTVKKKYLVYGFFGGLALITIISTIYSIARYGLFYVSIFANKTYYYDGILYPVYLETKYLDGFSFKEVLLGFGLLSSTLLSCAIPGALFVDKEKEKREFWLLLGLGAIGLLSLLSAPYKRGLIVFAIAFALSVLISSLIKHNGKGSENAENFKKFWLILTLVLAGLALVILALLYLDANINPGRAIIPTTYFASIENVIFKSLHVNNNGNWSFSLTPALLGQTWTSYFANNTPLTENRDLSVTNGFAAILGQNGLICFVLVVALILFAFYNLHSFINDETFFMGGKVALLAASIALFLAFCFCYDESPFTHEPQRFISITRSGPCLIGAFLIGVLCSSDGFLKGKKMEVNVNE